MSPADFSLPPPPCTPDTADRFSSTPAPGLATSIASWRGPVLVLGAGGKMGLHLCLMLRRASPPTRRIIAVSRFQSLRDLNAFQQHGIETIATDLSDPAAVAALPDARIVFFLAGVKFGTAAAPDLLHQMNVHVPQLVAHRFRGSTIVAFSTGCVYPFVPVTSAGATEATPPRPVGAYAASCLQREEAFARAAADGATRVALIRLNYAVEFRYGVLVDIASKVLRREPIDVTMGHVNLIWQGDALADIIRAHELAAGPARPLNVTGAGVHRVRDLAADFGRLFQREPVIIGQEADNAWLNDARLLHRRWGAPPTTLATMERWVASWLAAGFPTWGKPTGFEKRDGQF
jgi:nucleoside-diphosphate-sugar epimerase